MTSGGGAGGSAIEVVYVEVQARADEQSLRQLEQQVGQAGATAGEQGGKGIRGAIGGVLSSLPGLAIAAAAAVGAALVGGVTAATNFAQQARQGVKEIGAELGVSGAEAERLGEVAKRVFGNNWGEDLKGAQQAVATVRKEVKGLTDEDLQAVTEGSLAIADRFGEDQAKVAQSVQSVMQATGASAQEAMDLITAGFQKGLNKSGDYLDTLNEYGPQFEKAKLSGSQLFSLLETGSAAGALGTDKIADAFKEFSLRAADGAVATKQAYAQLGLDYDKLTKQLSTGALTYGELFSTVTKKIQGVQDQAARTNITTALLGGSGEDLGSKLGGIDLAKTKLSDLKGSTDQVKDSYNTLGSVFQTAGRQVLLQLQPIGDLVLDLANEAMPTVQAAIQRLGPIVTQVVRFLVDGFRQSRETAGQFAPYFQQALSVVMPVVQALGNVVQATFVLIRNYWENVLRPAFLAILPVVTTVFGTAGQIIKVAFDTVTNILNAVAALFRGDFKGALDFLSKAVETAFNGLQKTLDGAVPKLLEQGKNLGIKLIEGFRSGLTGLGAMLLTALADAVDRAAEGAPTVMKRLFGAVSAAAREEAGQLAQQSAEARANVAAVSGYQGAGPRLDSTPNLNIPEEAGKFGYAYISKLKDVFVNDPKVASDCAVIASAILHNLGLKIQGSANAGTLEKNALKAGFQPVDGDEIKPGDLIVWTSGNGKTYGAVSGKHVGVAAGYLNGKLQVIENPGSKNTQVNTIYDQQNAVAYRAPTSPFAQTAAPKSAPTPAPASGGAAATPVTVPLKPVLTVKDIQTELSTKIANIQAQVQLKLIGPAEAIKQLKALEDGAIAAGRKGGDTMGAYAQAATQARSVIDGLKKGSGAAVDVLASLNRQYEYAGKSGLPAYISGLQAFIAQQEKVVSSTRAGTKVNDEATDRVIAARRALAEVTKAAAVGLTQADITTYRGRAEQVISLEKAMATSTDVEWKRRAQNRIDAYASLPPAAQKVLDLLKGQDSQETASAQARRTALAAVSQAVAAGRIKDGQRALDEAKRLQGEEVAVSSLTADQRVRIYTSSGGKILSATYALHAEEKRQADAAVDAWAKSEAAKALTTQERDAEVLRRKAENRSTERTANLTAQREQAGLLRAATDLQIAESQRATAALVEGTANAYALIADLANNPIGERTNRPGPAVNFEAQQRRNFSDLYDTLTQLDDATIDNTDTMELLDKMLQNAAQSGGITAAQLVILQGVLKGTENSARAMAEGFAAGKTALDEVLANPVGERTDRAPAARTLYDDLLPQIEALDVGVDEAGRSFDFFTDILDNAGRTGALTAEQITHLKNVLKQTTDAAAQMGLGVEAGEDALREVLANPVGEGTNRPDPQGTAQRETYDNLRSALDSLDLSAIQNTATMKLYSDMVANAGKSGGITAEQLALLNAELARMKLLTDVDADVPVTSLEKAAEAALGKLDDLVRGFENGQVTGKEFAAQVFGAVPALERMALAAKNSGNTELAADLTTTIGTLQGLVPAADAAAYSQDKLSGAHAALSKAMGETEAPYADQIAALEALRGEVGVNQEVLEVLITRFKELQDRDLRLEATVVVNGVDTGLKALDLYKTGIQGVGDLIQGVFSDLVSGSETSVQGILANMAKMALGIVKQVAVAIVAYQAQAIALALLKGGAFDFVGAGVALAAAAAVAGIAAGLSARLEGANAPTAPTPSTGTTSTSSATTSTTSSTPSNAQVSIPTSQVTVMAAPEWVGKLDKTVGQLADVVGALAAKGIPVRVTVDQPGQAARSNSLAYELGTG